jgi:chemotaxis protein CheC
LLSEMANQRVLLHVPEVEILSMEDGNDWELPTDRLFRYGHIVSSTMKFGYNFSGRALLIFPARKAKLLVDACLGEFDTRDPQSVCSDLEDTDFDVLKEISNVILNCVIGEFGNMLGVKLEFSLPDVELIFVSEEEQKLYLKNSVHIMIFYTAFTLAETKVDGVILIALSVNSLNMLISKIDTLLGELND